MSDRIVLLNHGRIEQSGAPDELYFRPRTVFAADFLGDSSMLDAVVAAPGKYRPALTDACGRPLLAEATELAPGTPVKAMIRPENVHLLRGEDAGTGLDTVLEGLMEDSIVLGSVVRHHIRLLEGGTMLANEFNARGRAGAGRGQPVRFGYAPRTCWCWSRPRHKVPQSHEPPGPAATAAHPPADTSQPHRQHGARAGVWLRFAARRTLPSVSRGESERRHRADHDRRFDGRNTLMRSLRSGS